MMILLWMTQVGDVVQLLYRVNEDWLFGRCGLKEGIFPQNFIKVSSRHIFSSLCFFSLNILFPLVLSLHVSTPFHHTCSLSKHTPYKTFDIEAQVMNEWRKNEETVVEMNFSLLTTSTDVINLPACMYVVSVNTLASLKTNVSGWRRLCHTTMMVNVFAHVPCSLIVWICFNHSSIIVWCLSVHPITTLHSQP